MSDLNRLEEKIAKLNAASTGVSANGREIPASDSNSLFRAILLEIDETMLARELIFENDNGITLGLEVANRRLLRFSGLSDENHSELAAPLLEKTFSQDNSPLIEALFEVFTVFLQDTTKLLVRSAKLSTTSNPTDIGCSPQGLAEAWSIDLYEGEKNEHEKHFMGFLNACSEFMLACVQFDDNGISEKTGQENELSLLSELVQSDFSQLNERLKNSLHSDAAPQCLMLGPDGIDGQSILYFSAGDKRALMNIPAEQASEVYQLWRGKSA